MNSKKRLTPSEAREIFDNTEGLIALLKHYYVINLRNRTEQIVFGRSFLGYCLLQKYGKGKLPKIIREVYPDLKRLDHRTITLSPQRIRSEDDIKDALTILSTIGEDYRSDTAEHKGRHVTVTHSWNLGKIRASIVEPVDWFWEEDVE